MVQSITGIFTFEILIFSIRIGALLYSIVKIGPLLSFSITMYTDVHYINTEYLIWSPLKSFATTIMRYTIIYWNRENPIKYVLPKRDKHIHAHTQKNFCWLFIPHGLETTHVKSSKPVIYSHLPHSFATNPTIPPSSPVVKVLRYCPEHW